jgi:hypothetical protein
MLGAEGAAGAVVADAVFDEGGAFASRAAALQMRFVFVAEIPQRGEHRVRGGFAETAEAAGAYLMSKVFKFSHVLPLAFAGAEPLQEVQHAPGADAAEGAFAARLVLSKLKEIARNIDHAGGVIEHDQAA